MDFSQAIKMILDGQKITRKSWNDREIYGQLFNGQLMIRNGTANDGLLHPWIVNDGDMAADDWTVKSQA